MRVNSDWFLPEKNYTFPNLLAIWTTVTTGHSNLAGTANCPAALWATVGKGETGGLLFFTAVSAYLPVIRWCPMGRCKSHRDGYNRGKYGY